jgi:hypothetical protein
MPFLQLEPDFTTPSAGAGTPPPIVPPDPAAPSRLPITGKPAPAAPKAPKPKEEGPARTLWYPSGKEGGAPAGGSGKLDELAFLKSVTNEPAPAPRRGSGSYPKVPAEPPPAAAPPPPAPPAPAAPVITTADPFASKSQPAIDPKSRGSTPNVPKTLKCAECGTLNRPTEWYCERCGAELAAL